MKKTTLALIAAALLAGCSSLNPAATAADRARYESIAPEYRACVESNPALSADEKQARLDLLAAWKLATETETD